MAKKIFTKGNYFYIVDTVKSTIYEGLKKDVRVRKLKLNSNEFSFDNINGLDVTVIIPLSDIQKEDGSAYTISEFITFYENETGNFNVPQASGVTPEELATALEPILQKLDILLNNALIEFDVTKEVPANTDSEFEITPVGTEIRSYQIFEVSNPTQDITSDVSSLIVGTNKIRIFTTLPLSIKIMGTRTQV